jgi:DMSO/TMAO reductase YedYZ heme-binding membrane subunit
MQGVIAVVAAAVAILIVVVTTSFKGWHNKMQGQRSDLLSRQRRRRNGVCSWK